MNCPTIDLDLDLGVLGKQCAEIGYDTDHRDVRYVIVDNGPLYMELEITTLNEATQAEIYESIRVDAMERSYAAQRYLSDLEREDGCRV